METSAEVAMGSREGFSTGGGDIRHYKGSCSHGDNINAVNVSAPESRQRIPDFEVRVEVCHPSSFHSDVNIGDSGNIKSCSPKLDLDSKPVLLKSGKIVRKNSGCTKRSGIAHMEVSKNNSVVHDVNGTLTELPSSSASCNVSEKTSMVKQKNSSASRRGDKRNSKVNHKSRCDSFSLKNGLVGFNSAAGGNNLIGLRGSKSDAFDITKYADEPSLDELLSGSYSRPFMKDKEKATTNSNSNLLQSVRSACSILQAQRVSQAQNSAVSQTDSRKGDNCLPYQPSLEKVDKFDGKVNALVSLLYAPRVILQHLAIPPLKDLDVLLSDASKHIPSKYITDHRLGKQPISQRTGLPPFSWSYPFSGHNKSASDAVKLSMIRTVCKGKWTNVKNCITLQKDSGDLLKDFESLKFNQGLVPKISKHHENEFAPREGALSASSRMVPADEHSTTHAAAQMLLDMSNKNSRSLVKKLKKPSQKLKVPDRSKISFRALKSQHNPPKARDGFSSKKLKLSPTDITVDPFSSQRKLVRDPNAKIFIYGANVVKKPCAIKTPRGVDRPGSTSSSKPKPQKSSQ